MRIPDLTRMEFRIGHPETKMEPCLWRLGFGLQWLGGRLESSFFEPIWIAELPLKVVTQQGCVELEVQLEGELDLAARV
jgi:hypothetical protein